MLHFQCFLLRSWVVQTGKTHQLPTADWPIPNPNPRKKPKVPPLGTLRDGRLVTNRCDCADPYSLFVCSHLPGGAPAGRRSRARHHEAASRRARQRGNITFHRAVSDGEERHTDGAAEAELLSAADRGAKWGGPRGESEGQVGNSHLVVPERQRCPSHRC